MREASHIALVPIDVDTVGDECLDQVVIIPHGLVIQLLRCLRLLKTKNNLSGHK